MNPGKEEGKEREGGDENKVVGRGALPASPECLLRRCLFFFENVSLFSKL